MSKPDLYPVTPLATFIMLGSMASFSCIANQTQWQSLFNGKDLTGWTAKFVGQPLGINYLDTFRVEDGVLKASYQNYDEFDHNFGHLFYQTSYSHYRLRLEYRFTGEQIRNGPQWAYRNAGIMFHSPAPETMRIEQFFPVSLELQLLGGNGVEQRHTGNVCSPSSHLEMDGELVTNHCIESSSKTFHGDQWVRIELEVHGNQSIKHYVNGELVLEYNHPVLDLDDADGRTAHEQGWPIEMSQGYFAIQAESHPVEYRNISLMILDK